MPKLRIQPPAMGDGSRLLAFDPVKLDLAMMVLVALGVALVIAGLDAPHWVELLIMAAVGLGSGAWIMLRTWRVLYRVHASGAMGGGNDR